MKISSIIFLILFSSCSTLNKTKVYTAIAGAVLGGFIGKELSPDKTSDKLNIMLGATLGTASGTALGHFMYTDANPSHDLKQSPLKRSDPITPIIDNSFGMDKIKIMPKIAPTSKKKYFQIAKNLPREIKKGAKKQYYRKYKTEAYSFEEDGKKYQVPSFEIIELGIE